jgi:hypothetical protein
VRNAASSGRGDLRELPFDAVVAVPFHTDAKRDPRPAHARGAHPGPCHDAVVTLPLVPGTLILSRNVKAADLFLPQEVALFVAVDEVDHRGWRVAHPVKDVSIHTDVPAQRSSVTLSYWDDTLDQTVDGEVDVEVHTIAKQV